MKKEIEYIHRLIADYPKVETQINVPFHADAEITRCLGGYLGVSVDAVSEELEMGLVIDPVTLGWITVTASVSDLAAVGMKTERVSILFKDSAQDSEWVKLFLKGARDAAKAYQCKDIEEVILKQGSALTACTAYAWSLQMPKLSRMGLKDGDSLFLTGPIGWGNAVALANLAIRKNHPQTAQMIDSSYRPQARWQEGLFIQDFASVCIDTSDGLLSTMKWLEILNNKKLEVNYSESLFHKVALEVARMANVNPWLFMAAQNGEFELLFAVPPEKKSAFLIESQKKGFFFLEVGRVLDGDGLALKCEGATQSIPLNLGNLLDMLHEGVDPQQYILAMLRFSVSNEIKLEGWP